MKSYTDINQSKKLAEILPIESADMYYSKYDTIHANMLYGSCDVQYFSIHEFIPCWSLTALLELIPCADIEKLDNTWTCDSILDRCEADNLVDACYETILKIHEFKLL